jgi:hypothetical protein
LRFVLNDLVAAIDYNNSVSKILSGDQPAGIIAPNDGVVTLASQTANVNTGIPWPSLEHTATPIPSFNTADFETLLNVTGLSDANVLNSDGVDAMALCFMVSGGTSNCAPNSGAVAQERVQTNSTSSRPCGPTPSLAVIRGGDVDKQGSEPGDSSPCAAPESVLGATAESAKKTTVPSIFLANDRVNIETPSKDLVLAEENEISLNVHSPGLLKTATYQRGEAPEPPIAGGVMETPIQHRQDGSTYILIRPMRLGEVTLSISGRFPDGGYFHKEVRVNVRPPERGPSKLTVGDLSVIRMHLAGQNRRKLNVTAFYDGVIEPIWIGAPFVRYTLKANGQAPVISVDETNGVITPLNTGEVLVTTTFGGKEVLTCVVVTQNFYGYNDPAPCERLLRPGQQLPSLLTTK